MQLGDSRAVVGVDAHGDIAGEGDLLVEEVPHDVVDDLDARHRDEAAAVLDRADVADLAAAPGWNAERSSTTRPGAASTTTAPCSYRSGCA